VRKINAVTLEEVNDNLLERLNSLIQDADAEQLLAITEVVAKLNTSRRNSDQFVKPESEEAKSEKERAAVLGEVING
jgi:predicted house-cleaning noncanonical NTP pyrophosphatase (MazG superfamily)